jgi:hypothetical protein
MSVHASLLLICAQVLRLSITVRLQHSANRGHISPTATCVSNSCCVSTVKTDAIVEGTVQPGQDAQLQRSLPFCAQCNGTFRKAKSVSRGEQVTLVALLWSRHSSTTIQLWLVCLAPVLGIYTLLFICALVWWACPQSSYHNSLSWKEYACRAKLCSNSVGMRCSASTRF